MGIEPTNDANTVTPVFGMISQNGKAFSWLGKNKEETVCVKTGRTKKVFLDCPPGMPVVDFSTMHLLDVQSFVGIHHVEEATDKAHWDKDTIGLSEYLSVAKARGAQVLTVQQIQEQATAELHTH